MIAPDMPTVSQQSASRSILGRLGPLRVMLVAAMAVVILAAPFADGTTHAHDWRLLPGVVAPTIMMMLVFAIPLDVTMARVFLSDADATERARLWFAIKVELLVYALMLMAWAPFVVKVLDFNPFE